MDTYKKFKDIVRATKAFNRSQVSDAVQAGNKVAQIMFDVSTNNGSVKLDSNKNAPLKAMELVSAMFGDFGLPTRPKLSYLGSQKRAANKDGLIQEGVINIGANIRTLTGHKADIEIPVIVRNGHLLDPAIFIYNGAPYVISASALDGLVKGATLEKIHQVRKMYQPPMPFGIEHPDMPRSPIVNKDHMFTTGPRHPWQMRRGQKDTPRSRPNIDEPVVMPTLWTCDVPDEMLDPAERSRDGVFEPGAKVRLTQDLEVLERGGTRLTLPSGEAGVVVRDVEGDGKMLYVQFHELCCKAAIPKHFLKSAATVDQVRNEVKDMIREGYKTVDIKDAMMRRYPEVATEALQGLKE